jgi:Xaa-Pro aminopeptidase
MTELDVAVELEYAMRKGGADSFAFETIAVSGDASALPHGTPRNLKLRRGFLTMDFGAKFDGYCSDMTRTIVIGKADDDIKKLYNTVLRAQTEALNYLREGADCGEADKIARDIIDAVPEYKGAFGHSLGHSVGLFIHESPRLYSRGFGRKLNAGEILTVEPGIYLFGKYGCRIEDMVAVTKDGIHNFTHSPKDLIEIL